MGAESRHRLSGPTRSSRLAGSAHPKVRVEAGEGNGLHEDSAADFLQVRSVAVERLLERLGELDAALVEEVVAGIVIGIDYRP